MPRPYQPIKRIKSNSLVWYVQVRDTNGKRHSLSLETTDRETAMRRYGQAMKLLQDRIREKEEGARPSKWLADEPVTVWDIPSLPDGSNDYENATAKTVQWSEVAENDDLIRTLEWGDLVKEAEKRRLRRTGKPYSDAWREGAQTAINGCPFGPEHATPENIRGWIDAMDEEGLAPKTIQQRCAALSGLLTSAKKTGFRQDLVNGFSGVDYTTKVVTHHTTAEDSDYVSLINGLAPTIPDDQRLCLLALAYGGMNIKEMQDRKLEDLEVDERGIGWLSIYKSKTDARTRVIPLPAELTRELQAKWPKAWPHSSTLNRRTKEITNHSWRHGFKRLSREAGVDPVLTEALMGHEIGRENRLVMESTYGSSYPKEPILKGAQQIWDYINNITNT